MSANPFLLAADNPTALLDLLRDDPTIASSQDDYGYSLVHAAASYGHIDLLRKLVLEFKVDVDIKDEDKETALFVVETVDVAKVLVEELNADANVQGDEGLTARAKIEAEGDFPAVAAYLTVVETGSHADAQESAATSCNSTQTAPEGLDVTIVAVDEEQDIPLEVDQEFRRRIEELAQRDDLDTAGGQADLRRLVMDAVADQNLGDERSTRQRQK